MAAAPTNVWISAPCGDQSAKAMALTGFLAARRARNVLGDHAGARLEHALRPARDVRCHDHIAQLMEWRGRGCRAPRAGGVVVPDIERGTGETSACQRIVERL